jgi:two-component sensor histidine kinase
MEFQKISSSAASAISRNIDLVAEANHRVANSLALLGGLVRMQGRAIGKNFTPYSNAEIRLLFDGIAARIATIGQLHRMLAATPGDGAIVLNMHLRDVCASLVTAFSSERQPVRIEHLGTDCLVLTRYVQPITLIVCEILTNAMKYAHPAGVAIGITVHCEAKLDGRLFLSISDDGVGLPESFDTKKDGGVGFQIIRALATELDARLDIVSDNLGASFQLTVPQALVANARSA